MGKRVFRKDLEFLDCKRIIEWRDANIPTFPALQMLIHIPNEGKRSMQAAIKLKQAGMTKGAPDFVLLLSSLAIEQKTLTGELSSDQKRFRDAYTALGGNYVVSRSPEQTVYEVKKALGMP